MAEAIQLITSVLLDSTVAVARSCPRLRTNHNFHSHADDNPHRFLNALVRGTYVVPHRHVTPPKSEAFVVLRGTVAFFIFNDDGSIRHCYHLGDGGALGIDLEPGIWHSMAVRSESAVIFEVKPGPYAAQTDKDYAPFAPREEDPMSREYLTRLVAHAEKSG